MRRVSPGEPLRISAMDWNRIAELVDSDGLSQTRKPYQGSNSPCIVLGCNQTGATVEMGMTLVLGGLRITPAENEEDFLSGSVYDLVYSGNGILGVALQPIEPGEIGPVVISGHVPVLVSVSDSSHLYANPGGNGYLVSTETGEVRLSYTNQSTGLVWCNAVLGAGGGGGGEGGISSGQYTGPFAINVLGDLPQSSIRVSGGTVHCGAWRLSVPQSTFAAASTGTYYVKLTVTWTGAGYSSYTSSISLVGSSTETFSFTAWEKVLGVVQASSVTDATTGESAVKWTAFSQWWMGGNLEVPGRCV